MLACIWPFQCLTNEGASFNRISYLFCWISRTLTCIFWATSRALRCLIIIVVLLMFVIVFFPILWFRWLMLVFFSQFSEDASLKNWKVSYKSMLQFKLALTTICNGLSQEKVWCFSYVFTLILAKLWCIHVGCSPIIHVFWLWDCSN